MTAKYTRRAAEQATPPRERAHGPTRKEKQEARDRRDAEILAGVETREARETAAAQKVVDKAARKTAKKAQPPRGRVTSENALTASLTPDQAAYAQRVLGAKLGGRRVGLGTARRLAQLPPELRPGFKSDRGQQ